MAHGEFSRDEIPSEGVSIGGDDDCEHATYRRFGSDGGGTIYVRCTNCSNVLRNYDSRETNRERSAVDADLISDSSGAKHAPLLKGRSLGSDGSKRPAANEGAFSLASNQISTNCPPSETSESPAVRKGAAVRDHSGTND
jgi:hypothetical protein